MFVSRRRFEALRDENRCLKAKVEILEYDLKKAINMEHETSPLCVGCVNCIETGEGYFSDGLKFNKYECKLSRTCKDFEEKEGGEE